ncbi:MAG TPA: hypothetical protein ENI27_10595 [bacterium]|nr:hypothetical protein [bacterium]
MNRDETKKAIEVMQAFVDGAKPEQKTYSGNYGGPIDPHWNWDNDVNMYHIKPKEPREFWLWDSPSIFPTGSGTVSWSDSKPRHIDHPIKVREVL